MHSTMATCVSCNVLKSGNTSRLWSGISAIRGLYTNTEFRKWIGNYIHLILWDIIVYLFILISTTVSKPPSIRAWMRKYTPKKAMGITTSSMKEAPTNHRYSSKQFVEIVWFVLILESKQFTIPGEVVINSIIVAPFCTAGIILWLHEQKHWHSFDHMMMLNTAAKTRKKS